MPPTSRPILCLASLSIFICQTAKAIVIQQRSHFSTFLPFLWLHQHCTAHTKGSNGCDVSGVTKSCILIYPDAFIVFQTIFFLLHPDIQVCILYMWHDPRSPFYHSLSSVQIVCLPCMCILFANVTVCILSLLRLLPFFSCTHQSFPLIFLLNFHVYDFAQQNICCFLYYIYYFYTKV